MCTITNKRNNDGCGVWTAAYALLTAAMLALVLFAMPGIGEWPRADMVLEIGAPLPVMYAVVVAEIIEGEIPADVGMWFAVLSAVRWIIIVVGWVSACSPPRRYSRYNPRDHTRTENCVECAGRYKEHALEDGHPLKFLAWAVLWLVVACWVFTGLSYHTIRDQAAARAECPLPPDPLNAWSTLSGPQQVAWNAATNAREDCINTATAPCGEEYYIGMTGLLSVLGGFSGLYYVVRAPALVWATTGTRAMRCVAIVLSITAVWTVLYLVLIARKVSDRYGCRCRCRRPRCRCPGRGAAGGGVEAGSVAPAAKIRWPLATSPRRKRRKHRVRDVASSSSSSSASSSVSSDTYSSSTSSGRSGHEITLPTYEAVKKNDEMHARSAAVV